MDRLLLYSILKGKTGAEVSASGNPITLPNTIQGGHLRDMKLYGWSKQESTTGAQLLDISKWSAYNKPTYGLNTSIDDGIVTI